MKTKLFIASLLVSGSLIMAFAAAKVETCADKYTTCTDVCTNQKAHDKASGSTDQTIDSRYNGCMNKCNKAKQDCEKNEKKTK